METLSTSFQAFSGESDYVGEYADFAYRGTMLWAEAVKKANSVVPELTAPMTNYFMPASEPMRSRRKAASR